MLSEIFAAQPDPVIKEVADAVAKARILDEEQAEALLHRAVAKLYEISKPWHDQLRREGKRLSPELADEILSSLGAKQDEELGDASIVISHYLRRKREQEDLKARAAWRKGLKKPRKTRRKLGIEEATRRLFEGWEEMAPPTAQAFWEEFFQYTNTLPQEVAVDGRCFEIYGGWTSDGRECLFEQTLDDQGAVNYRAGIVYPTFRDHYFKKISN